MLETIPRECPLCGPGVLADEVSPAKISYETLDAYAFASRKLPEYMHHRLVRCRGCGLVYANPAPAAGTLATAYKAAGFDSGPEAAYASITYGRLVDSILPRLPSRDGAFDIGTGDGSFLLELLRRDFTHVAGVEPSTAPVGEADQRVRNLIHHGVFELGLCAPASQSLITCFQTIEHLHDPLGVCRTAATMLRPGGILLMVGHNRRSLSARLLGEKSPIYDVEHLQLFDRQTAALLMRRAGLVQISVKPLVNRYPMAYWAKVFPFPGGSKRAVISALHRLGLADRTLPLPAGNMVFIGRRPSSLVPG